MPNKNVLFSQAIFIGILSVSTALVFLGIRSQLNYSIVLNSVALLMFFTVLGLEKAMPFKKEWNEKDPQTLNDLGHTLFGTALGAMSGDFLTKLIFANVALWISDNVGFTFWPTHWPLMLQVVLVFLLAEFGRYWQHRLMHLHPGLWRYHRLHHSIDRMGVLKTSRSHIMERIFQQVFMFSFLIAIGAPKDVMLLYIIPNSFLGMIDHSNIDLKLGYLEYVFMGPAGHRLHHSEDMVTGNTNFGSAMLVWDVIFGTFSDPVKTPPPDRVGIPDDPMPSGFVDQIIDGFSIEGLQLKEKPQEVRVKI